MTMKPMIYSTKRVRETLYKGTHDGYDFEIISFGYHPCAYVTLSETHPYADKDYDEIDIDVHGGLTYMMGNTIGWDYGHCYDYSPLYNLSSDKKWTTEEIFEDVKDVIRQLKEAEVDDEQGSGGLWDLSGEIALKVGLIVRDHLNLNDVLFASDCGQDIVYEMLKEYMND